MRKTRTYSELRNLKTIQDRFEYLKLSGSVGLATFGFDRYLNQKFYKSSLWKQVRNQVIVRDEGCDLGVSGFEIHNRILIHHMNPIQIEDFLKGNLDILDPEFLVVTSPNTHQAIHYGDERLLPKVPVARRSGDTRLW